MCPELNPVTVGKVIRKNWKGKFVRSGGVIWIDEGRNLSHGDLAMMAGFKVVDDAGQISRRPGINNSISISGSSRDFDKRGESSARNETIEIAQKALGNSAKIIKR